MHYKQPQRPGHTGRGRDEDRKIKRKRQGNSPRCTISVQIHYSQYVITSSSRGDIFLEHMEGKKLTIWRTWQKKIQAGD
jgi:hypothetical protein